MSCYHPLLATRTADPKKPVKIISKEPYLDRETTDLLARSLSVDIRTGEAEADFFLVPCGKCAGCRLDYSREWADRCTMEAMMYSKDKCHFITLTYDDENLPAGKVFRPSLDPKDLTDFMKRFRIQAERDYNIQNIRFYACGEYGSKGLRPHYHLLVYGITLPDLKEFFLNKMHQQIYTSEWVSKIWGKGLVSIGGLDWRCAAYVARYVMKKQKGQGAASYYEERGIVPEFVRMSLKPGIGLPYFEAHAEEIYKNDNIVLPPIDGNKHIVKPPRYFDDKYKSLNDECARRLEEIKKRRASNAQDHQDTLLRQTDLDLKGYFEMSEQALNRSLKMLKRNLE